MPACPLPELTDPFPSFLTSFFIIRKQTFRVWCAYVWSPFVCLYVLSLILLEINLLLWLGGGVGVIIMCSEFNITVLYTSTVSYNTSQHYAIRSEWIVLMFFSFKFSENIPAA